MKVNLKILLPKLPEAIGRKELEVEFAGETVNDLIEHLVARHGRKARQALYDEKGKLDPVVQVLLSRTLRSPHRTASSGYGGDIVNDHLSHLRGHERAAVSECVGRLRKILGEQLIGAWLFGSKARGDFGPDSDIDLLIVIPELGRFIWSSERFML
jgi:hypothetical protein